MGLRVCLVTPFSWSQRHEVNDHVAAAAEGLRSRGHSVCVVAPSNRAAALTAGRRALKRLGRDGELPEGVLAIGPAISLARRSSVGVPVGVRANLELVLDRGRFDVVHAHEPGLPSISYIALRDAHALSVATFHSSERLGYPTRSAQRAKLLARIDALTATSEAALAAARARFPGEYTLVPQGIDTRLFHRGDERRPRFVLEWDPSERAIARAAVRALRQLPGFELVLLRPRSGMAMPYVPRDLRPRVLTLTIPDPPRRAELLRGAAGFVPAGRGSLRLRLEALASAVPVVEPLRRDEQPELVAAAMARLAEDAGHRQAEAEEALRAAEGDSVDALGESLERLYLAVVDRRRRPEPPDRLADRPWILVDMHLHTDASHDCSVPPAELVGHAEAIGLGGIAVTDHNAFRGAREAVELARGRDLVVIPGEEVKTDNQGEVIGLFLQEEIPGGMSMERTVAAIREQGGLVYLPHPFDRLHAIPDAATLHRHLPEIDVFEIYNARLLFEGFNDEALRFARKYNLLMGAGSDAHVLPGLGTGCVRMRAFETPEEFLLSLRSAEIVRRPKSLLYLQSLKWAAGIRGRRRETLVR
jgi:predicted metal-dependent phosphoesterase TrpH/glycosyltransferase involved in cell wall biosynthesis